MSPGNTLRSWIDEVIMNWQNEDKLKSIRETVKELTKKFPLYSL
jgi:glycine/serine hydroxymethyltransferase